jgi:pectate lyase
MKSISIPHRAAASLFGLAWLALGALTSFGQNDRRAGDLLRQPEEWFRGAEGRRITTNVLSWQSAAGSWPKNQSTTRTPYVGDNAGLKGTFDNGATTDEIRFLARAFLATREERCRQAVRRGLDHILAAQYPTGGWPQYAPPPEKSYHRHITFNDGTMVRLMELLREVASAPTFDGVDPARRAASRKAFDRGVACILQCQIRVHGRLTVWCAQHDEKDLTPKSGRSYELASLSGAESAGILRLLMSLDHPDAATIDAIQAGVDWFASARITGWKIGRDGGNKVLIADADAPPLWARFYNLETGRPFFCGRDGVPKDNFNEIEAERRNGYAWHGNWGESVAQDYAKWSKNRAPAPGAPPAPK